jgi:hypothetical protein
VPAFFASGAVAAYAAGARAVADSGQSRRGLRSTVHAEVEVGGVLYGGVTKGCGQFGGSAL